MAGLPAPATELPLRATPVPSVPHPADVLTEQHRTSAQGWTGSHSQVYVSAVSGRQSNSMAAQTGHMIATLGGSRPSSSSPAKAVQPRACSSLAQPHSPHVNNTSPGISVRIFEGSAQAAETDVGGSIVRAGGEAVGAANLQAKHRGRGGMPQVPRPLGHGAAPLVTGALTDGVRCIVCGTGVDYVVFA